MYNIIHMYIIHVALLCMVILPPMGIQFLYQIVDIHLRIKCEAAVRYCFSMTVYFCQIIVHICMSKTCQQCGNHRDSESRPLLEAGHRHVNGSAGSTTEKESKSRNKFTADNETLQNKNYTSIA